MTKQTATIITLVGVVLALCCSVTCCASGILVAADDGYILGTYIEPGWGALPICLGLLVWGVPLLLWIFLLRGKE